MAGRNENGSLADQYNTFTSLFRNPNTRICAPALKGNESRCSDWLFYKHPRKAERHKMAFVSSTDSTDVIYR